MTYNKLLALAIIIKCFLFELLVAAACSSTQVDITPKLYSEENSRIMFSMIHTIDCNGLNDALESGADPNKLSGVDRPLGLAVKTGRQFRKAGVLLLELLLKHGADPALPDKLGNLPIHEAIKLFGQEPEFSLIKIKLLLRLNPEKQINTLDSEKRPVLLLASMYPELLKYLLEQGADPCFMVKEYWALGQYNIYPLIEYLGAKKIRCTYRSTNSILPQFFAQQELAQIEQSIKILEIYTPYTTKFVSERLNEMNKEPKLAIYPTELLLLIISYLKLENSYQAILDYQKKYLFKGK